MLVQKTETELSGTKRVINTSVALIKREEAEAEAARGHHAYVKPTTPGCDDSAPHRAHKPSSPSLCLSRATSRSDPSAACR